MLVSSQIDGWFAEPDVRIQSKARLWPFLLVKVVTSSFSLGSWTAQSACHYCITRSHSVVARTLSLKSPAMMILVALLWPLFAHSCIISLLSSTTVRKFVSVSHAFGKWMLTAMHLAARSSQTAATAHRQCLWAKFLMRRERPSLNKIAVPPGEVWLWAQRRLSIVSALLGHLLQARQVYLRGAVLLCSQPKLGQLPGEVVAAPLDVPCHDAQSLASPDSAP